MNIKKTISMVLLLLLFLCACSGQGDYEGTWQAHEESKTEKSKFFGNITTPAKILNLEIFPE